MVYINDFKRFTLRPWGGIKLKTLISDVANARQSRLSFCASKAPSQSVYHMKMLLLHSVTSRISLEAPTSMVHFDRGRWISIRTPLGPIGTPWGTPGEPISTKRFAAEIHRRHGELHRLRRELRRASPLGKLQHRAVSRSIGVTSSPWQ